MSLDSLELLVTIEEHFDIEIPDLEAEQIYTVGDFADSVYEKIKNLPQNTLSKSEVDKIVIEIISRKIGTPKVEIKLTHSITNDLGID